MSLLCCITVQKGKCVLTTEPFRLPQQLSEAWSPAGRTDVEREGGDKEDKNTPKVTGTWTLSRLCPTLVFRGNLSPVKAALHLTFCGDKTESGIH